MLWPSFGTPASSSASPVTTTTTTTTTTEATMASNGDQPPPVANRVSIFFLNTNLQSKLYYCVWYLHLFVFDFGFVFDVRQ